MVQQSLRALLRPFLLYTCLLAVLTVGVVYLTTDSGFFMLFAAGGGFLLVILTVGTAGPAGTGGVEHAEGAEMDADAVGIWPRADPTTSTNRILLCYGLGLFLWGFTLLFTLYDV